MKKCSNCGKRNPIGLANCYGCSSSNFVMPAGVTNRIKPKKTVFSKITGRFRKV